MNMDSHGGQISTTKGDNPITRDTKTLPSTSISSLHAAPEVIGVGNGAEGESAGEIVNEIQASHRGWFAYFKTREFYLVLLLGYGLTEIYIPSKEAVSYAELCGSQASPGPLSHRH